MGISGPRIKLSLYCLGVWSVLEPIEITTVPCPTGNIRDRSEFLAHALADRTEVVDESSTESSFGRPLAITQGAGYDRDLQWGAGLKKMDQIGYLFVIRFLTKFSKISVSRRPVMTSDRLPRARNTFPGVFLMIPSRGSPLGSL